jgi:pyridoxine 5-phosphate synthase
MPRITALLDEIIELSQNGSTGEPRPAKVAAMCELSGAKGVAIDIKGGEITPQYERLIKSIKEVLGIPLMVITPAEDKTVGRLIDLAPDLVILRSASANKESQVARLQVANIVVGVEIKPDIDQVKAVAKQKADYVAIDVSAYGSEKNLSARVDILNNISKAAALAERLALGVIASGSIKIGDLAKLAEINQIEEFLIGHELIAKSILFGLGQALAEISRPPLEAAFKWPL